MRFVHQLNWGDGLAKILLRILIEKVIFTQTYYILPPVGIKS